jgi:hypothetical protein
VLLFIWRRFGFVVVAHLLREAALAATTAVVEPRLM